MKMVLRALWTLVIGVSLSGCMTTGLFGGEEKAVLKGEKALAYIEVYTLNSVFPLAVKAKTPATAMFENTSKKAGMFSDRYLFLRTAPGEFATPGTYDLTAFKVGQTDWTTRTGEPFTSIEIKPGDVLYLGTFELKALDNGNSIFGRDEPILVDHSDIEAARRTIAADYPQLAKRMKPAILTGRSIRTAK